ncbi:exosortase A system-associated hydrolase 2 [Ectothiorhodospira mobilis]|uniref:Exosortase A system-associated hydrolase 2 n=1 Tax=Ectothiorhodospira mobilis TaxID=195064 RepID=A0A1I4P859_ECTMO|nr:hydrolase 2, exosortase A system-associated [Ectothiorhodospira mobilis]SFM23727.1 exosortase A system-associated hydrolase 2 [Ectothiorhodospira mobilis]
MDVGFIQGGRGALFRVIHRPPAGTPARGSVLYVHPFLEEHNKSRRMAALQARRLAAGGWTVIQPDLFGCGDSDGDFEQARWSGWVEDLLTCVREVAKEGDHPLILWGLRGGCLLLADLLPHLPRPPGLTLLWQPVPRGEVLLNQILRLRLASGLLAGGPGEGTQALRQRLQAGETLEVAGYGLHPEWAAGLAAAALQPPPAGDVAWFEVAAGDEPALSPAATRQVEAWRTAGHGVTARAVPGEPFWATQEIREVPEMIEATTRCVQEVMGP